MILYLSVNKAAEFICYCLCSLFKLKYICIHRAFILILPHLQLP
ncbi:SWIM zinc finger family protein [Murimonas intestini]